MRQRNEAILSESGGGAATALSTARAAIEDVGWLSGEQLAIAAFAPGRLDVMGGIADYSGATVLELPLSRGVVAIAQRTTDELLSVATIGPAAPDERPVTLPLGTLLDGPPTAAPERLRAALGQRDADWAAYVLGPLAMLIAEGLLQESLGSGLRIALWSDVTAGAGVSSSAALEVATLRALCDLYAPELDHVTGMRLATLAQAAEHRVALAPCGIMDQVTSTLGMSDHLLMLCCQPCDILGHRPLPPGVRVLGIESGVAHRVAAGHYGRVRAAAFMGRQMIIRFAAEDGLTEPLGGYLCNLPLARFEQAYASRLPEEVRGAEFLAHYGAHDDPATSIEPDTVYRVRACAAHPIYEATHIAAFLAALDAFEAGGHVVALIAAGDAMYRSHASYGARCGLGAPETDLLVTLAQERGPKHGVYGARVTGGGAGGTVAFLVVGSAGEEAIHEIAVEYTRRSGERAAVLTGSAHGALRYESMRFTPGQW